MIILDVSLPDINGFELCTMLRSLPFVNDTPILFLSVHQNARVVARALDCGGDDYMRKPFATRELTARVRALMRRTAPRQPGKLSTLQFFSNDTTVSVDGQSVVLTPTEYALLDYLCQHPAGYHSSAVLLQRLWDYPPTAAIRRWSATTFATSGARSSLIRIARRSSCRPTGAATPSAPPSITRMACPRADRRTCAPGVRPAC
ncbi:MAG: response regulator transcription factor [Anaerolineae bacterium]|nr:response regulator transcription factor [Anaerolineae bacterium]